MRFPRRSPSSNADRRSGRPGRVLHTESVLLLLLLPAAEASQPLLAGHRLATRPARSSDVIQPLSAHVSPVSSWLIGMRGRASTAPQGTHALISQHGRRVAPLSNAGDNGTAAGYPRRARRVRTDHSEAMGGDEGDEKRPEPPVAEWQVGAFDG